MSRPSPARDKKRKYVAPKVEAVNLVAGEGALQQQSQVFEDLLREAGA